MPCSASALHWHVPVHFKTKDEKDIKPVTATEWSQPNATISIWTPSKHSTLVGEETTLEAPADIYHF